MTMSECLSYAASRGQWVGTPGGCSFELVIDGDAAELSAQALALANEGITQHELLKAQAVAYVQRFISGDAARLHGQADSVSLRVTGAGDVLTLDLSFPGDAYGLWWVEFFHRGNGAFEPSAFGRFAW